MTDAATRFLVPRVTKHEKARLKLISRVHPLFSLTRLTKTSHKNKRMRGKRDYIAAAFSQFLAPRDLLSRENEL